MILSISILLMLSCSLLSVSATSFNTESTRISFNSYTVNSYSTHQAVSTYYREYLDMWLSSEAWFDTHVGLEGVGVTIGNLDFWELPSIFQDHLEWMGLNTWDNKDPYSTNAHLTIQFEGVTIDEATSAAELLISILEQFLIVDFHYDGYNSFDDWRGEWVEIIEVWYSGHVDWTNVVQTYENAIPREKGGIAAAINVTEANGLNFDAWYDPGINEFIGRIGFSFNLQLDNIEGSHTISLKDSFHVSGFEASSEADGPLGIYVSLPDVSGLTVSPWYNDSYLYMEQNYHPNVEEPWNKNNIYSIWIELSSGQYIDDFILNFDYDFTPWDLATHERAEYRVDPRGYYDKSIHYYGKYATISSSPFDETLLTNVLRVHLGYSPLAYTIAGHTNIYFEIMFVDTLDYADEAYNIAVEIENLLGVTFDNNWTWEGSFWDWENEIDIPSRGYGYSIDNYTESNFTNLFTNSLAYQYSSMLNSSNILSDYTYIDWDIYKNLRYGYFGYHVDVRYDSLDYYIQTPVKAYPDIGYPENYTLDILSEFGWTTFPYSSNSIEHHLNVSVPIEQGSEFFITPDKPNGYGYNYWYWSDYRDNFTYGNFGFNYYIDTPYTTDNYGSLLDPVTQVTVDFYNEFISDDIDIEPPNIWGVCHYDGGWNYDMYTGLSGNTLLGVDVNDDGYMYYYDSTLGSDVPRFPGSGVASVEGKLYYGNLPIDMEGLVNPITFTYDSTADKYTSYVNFSSGEYADGEWELEIQAVDNDGNWGHMFETIVVDNYDDAIYVEPATITWTSTTPADGSSVSDNITIEVEVTDDIGVFLVVLWVNFGGWILEDPDADGIYSKEIDTTYYFEGPMEVIIEVWDMEGHYSSVSRSFTVDNIPSGDAPILKIISPVDGETVSGKILVQADVTDDVGLKSVTLTVDTRTPLLMSYNETSGYYEYWYDTNQLSNAYHTFTVTAIDEDENTHVVSQSVTVSVTGSTGTGYGDPPEYELVNVPVNQTQEELATQINEVTDETKAVQDIFDWEIRAKDDIGLAQVVLTIDDNVYGMSGSDSGPDTWSTWTYSWDSTEVQDGAHYATITITDIDENQHTVEIKIGFTTFNGNTKDKNTLGLDGFEFFWALLALAPLSVSINLLRRKKKV
ncbi:MAG: Ig-like domain-containing protein, partial [Candidatus Heimdallarchaeaceae archaeon]